MNKKTKGPPASASSFIINLTGGITFVLAVLLSVSAFPDITIMNVCMISMAAALVPILGGEIFFLKVHMRESAGLGPRKARDPARVRTKYAGLCASLALLILFYATVPEYTRDLYDDFHLFALLLLPAILLGGWFYIEEVDPYLKNSHDGLWHFGCLVTGKGKEVGRAKLYEFLRSLALRGFFVPIMFIYVMNNVTSLLDGQDAYLRDFIGGDAGDLPRVLHVILIAYLFLAAMDVLYALIGYLIVFRPLDTHIRSTEPTVLGWLVCLICYFPLWELFMISLFFNDFYNGDDWRDWFQGAAPVWVALWGTLLVSAKMMETFSTLTFGLRFSNLTYRGLISDGPFRLTKHPQYVSKMLHWFFFVIPFISSAGPLDALQRMIMFAGICFIYFLRARTEENHLSRYSEYVEYAEWINQNGVFRFINRFIPALRYSPEKAKQGRLI